MIFACQELMDIPSIHSLSLPEAEGLFKMAGWEYPEHSGQNATILFSPCGNYVVRLAVNDPGFEAFADMCDQNPSPCLPKLHINYLSDNGIHLTIADRYKRYGYDQNQEVEKKVQAVQSFIWGAEDEASKLDKITLNTLRMMLETAKRANAENPEIYYGLDLASEGSSNFLFVEKEDGSVQLVFTDAFARNGLPRPPNWQALYQKLTTLHEHASIDVPSRFTPVPVFEA